MSVVYEGVDEAGRVLAIKRVSRDRPCHGSCLEREARVLARIQHTNVVHPYGLVQRDRELWLLLEHVAGPTLEHFLWKNGELSAPTRRSAHPDVALAASARSAAHVMGQRSAHLQAAIRNVFLQLGQGIGALHASGVVHGDLKPSNVLIENTGRLVIIDFGLATTQRERETGAFIRGGTLEYLAPECLRGAAPSMEADWYSFGLMLYEAITGRLQRDYVLRGYGCELPAAHILCPNAPRDLSRLCAALLSSAPEARPRALEVLHVLGCTRRSSAA